MLQETSRKCQFSALVCSLHLLTSSGAGGPGIEVGYDRLRPFLLPAPILRFTTRTAVIVFKTPVRCGQQCRLRSHGRGARRHLISTGGDLSRRCGLCYCHQRVWRDGGVYRTREGGTRKGVAWIGRVGEQRRVPLFFLSGPAL